MNTVPPGQKVIFAEQAFLALAREWRDMAVTTEPDRALPEQADTAALACLLLAVECGKQFTKAANLQCEENELVAFSHWEPRTAYGQVESLAWGLCRNDTADDTSRTPVEEMIDAFTHPKSDFRCWMMKLGWMVRPWLPADKVVPLLLKNVDDTLGYVRLAMGLARGLCTTDEELEAFIAGYEHPTCGDQFAERIALFRGEGFALSQMEFWKLESRCRRMIERAALALSSVPRPGLA